MALLSDLVKDVLLYAPGAPEPLVIDKYREAARTFFRDTRIWRVTVSTITGVTTQKYALTLPADTELIDVFEVRFDDRRLDKATQTRMGRYSTTDKVVDRYTLDGDNILLMPDPQTDMTAKFEFVRAAVRPAPGVSSIDTTMIDKYGDIIREGTVGLLLTIPRRDWSDVKLGLSYLQHFRDEIDKWASRGMDGDMWDVPRTVRYGGL